MDEIGRRVLHQPFTAVSPYVTTPPSPPESSDSSTPGPPFFPLVHNMPPPYQIRRPLLQPSNGTIPEATQPVMSGKKAAILISVGIVALGLLFSLAFFIYRQHFTCPVEHQKPVRNTSRRAYEEPRQSPPRFVHLGTVEPNETSFNGFHHANAANAPDSISRFDRYRPSPELQPLPPLSKPQSLYDYDDFTASSSDKESQESTFHTPQHHSFSNGKTKNVGNINLHSHHNGHVHVKSRRTSSKSRFSPLSSPEMKHIIIPTVNKPTPKQQSIPNPPPPPPPPPSKPSQNLEDNCLSERMSRSSHESRSGCEPLKSGQPNHCLKENITSSSTPSLEASSKCFSLENGGTSTSNSALNEPPKSVELEKESGSSSSERNKQDLSSGSGSKTKLKPLHWDKVRATSDRLTVWDQLKSTSFKINEDMMEALFGCNSESSVLQRSSVKTTMPCIDHDNKVLDPKKSQNIAILLRALNVTKEEVGDALLNGNIETLGAELLETLVKMAPTKEEEIKLREYSDDISKLGSAERFLKAVLDIPFAFRRAEAMFFRANFDSEMEHLRKSFLNLEAASEELKRSRLFLKLLEAVLQTGNRMNVGTNRGGAKAFKLDTLLKLTDIKGADGKTTLLHFVVQEMIRSEGVGVDPTTANRGSSASQEEHVKKHGLCVVSGLSKELESVKKAAGMDSDVLSSYVLKLESGIEKIRAVLQCERAESYGNFFNTMRGFLAEAEAEIKAIKVEERKALLRVKDVTEYFHGDAAKEEAHPFRIFMIVRDFLALLDNVCKEIDRSPWPVSCVGPTRPFARPAPAPVRSKMTRGHGGSCDKASS